MMVDLMLTREKVGYQDENWNKSKYSGVSGGKQVDMFFKFRVGLTQGVESSTHSNSDH
jgi:hypothetical protein